jgi:hypothetical protein
MQVADEEVLSSFPAAIKRRVLRALYFEKLSHVYLLRAPYFADKPEFIVTLLERGAVELFVANVVVVPKGRRVNDLLVLLHGELEIIHAEWEKQQRNAAGDGRDTFWRRARDRLSGMPGTKGGDARALPRQEAPSWVEAATKVAADAVSSLTDHEKGVVAVAAAQVSGGVAPPAVHGGAVQYYVDGSYSVILGPGTCVGELAFFTRTKALVVCTAPPCARQPKVP